MLKTNEPSYSAASKTIKIVDSENLIDFETWLLYPSQDTAQPLTIGPYHIDAAENGKIASGEFPLLLISHGGGGSHLLYRIVAQYLAEKGFIVAMPEHHGNNRNDNRLVNDDVNLSLRSQHLSLVIDKLLSESEFAKQINSNHIYAIGHSIGGTAVLALAGAVPWSLSRQEIKVTHDHRIKALVLFAPASGWFQHPDSVRKLVLPMLVYAAEFDTVTPVWQADLICEGVENPARVKKILVANANHFSFLAPFPAHMKNKNFAPAQDRPGFDRVKFHERLKKQVFEFLSSQIKSVN